VERNNDKMRRSVGGCRLVSAAGAATGRAAGDRQFFYINGRPVDMPRASRHLNEAYKALTSPAAAVSKPFAILNWIVPTRR